MSEKDTRPPRLLRLAALALAALLTMAAGLALFAPWWPGSLLTEDEAGPGADRSGLPVYYSAPEFALVAQDGDTLRSEALEGTLWVASFIFTNCRSVCPLVTARMAELRDTLATEGLLGNRVRLVSITVDPARDTPPVLREYAGRYGGSPPEEWAFLTGEPPEGVRRLVQEGFRVSAMLPPEASEGAPEGASKGALKGSSKGAPTFEEDEPGAGGQGGSVTGDAPGSGRERLPGPGGARDTAGGYQVVHAPQVLLVDARRRVRSVHRPRDPEFAERLMGDIRALLPSAR